MNPRTTALLALVVAALGAFVYFYEIRGADQRVTAEDEAKRLFPGLAEQEIQVIELATSDGGRARIERTDEDWRMTAPIEFPADGFVADSLASSLAGLTSETVFDEPEAAAEYGLDGEPSLRFEVGGESRALRIGDKTPVGGNTYVALEDDPRVFAVTSFRANALSKTLKELRDPRILDFDRDAITSVEASWPGGRVSLARDETGWALTEPLAAAADEDALDALLSDLHFLRAEEFVDDPPVDDPLGPGEPAFQIRLSSEGDDATAELVVGTRSDGQTRVAQGRNGALYRIAEDRLDDLPRSVNEYRDKQLARFAIGDATGFELGFAGGSSGTSSALTGTLEEGEWQTEPESLTPAKASRLISELSNLAAADIAADAMGEGELEALSLSPPRVTLRVLAQEEGERTVLADVRIGELRPGTGIAAQVAGSDVVYWLDEGLAEHVPVSREALENRFVASAEAPALDEAPLAPDEPGS